MININVATHYLEKDKWTVSIRIGLYTTKEEAEELAEKIGPLIADTLDKVLR